MEKKQEEAHGMSRGNNTGTMHQMPAVSGGLSNAVQSLPPTLPNGKDELNSTVSGGPLGSSGSSKTASAMLCDG